MFDTVSQFHREDSIIKVSITVRNIGDIKASNVGIEIMDLNKVILKEYIGDIYPGQQRQTPEVKIDEALIEKPILLFGMLRYETPGRIPHTSPFLIHNGASEEAGYLILDLRPLDIEDTAYLVIRIQNLAPTQQEAKLKVISPNEIRARRMPSDLRLRPGEQKLIKIPFMNRWAPVGSKGQGFVVLSSPLGGSKSVAAFPIDVIRKETGLKGIFNLICALLLLGALMQLPQDRHIFAVSPSF